jgi:hypothetical protein
VTASTATLGGNISSDGGDPPITSRGTVWNTTGAPITENAVAQGGTTTGGFSHLRDTPPLNSGTLIYFRSYAVNGTGTGYGPDNSFYTEPANQPTGIAFPATTNNSMTINWSDPAGATAAEGAIVVMKEGVDPSAADEIPTDGFDAISYSPSSSWVSAGTIGAGGARVLFLGSGNSVNVTDLNPGTSYFVRIYEYAGVGTGDTGINYLEEAPLFGSDQTTAPVSLPTLSSTPTFASVTATTAVLGGTMTSDGGASVVCGVEWGIELGGPYPNQEPFGSCAVNIPFSVVVENLPQGDTIYFRAYVTNSAGTGNSLEDSFETLVDEPTVQASSITFPRVSGRSLRIRWTRGDGEGSIVVMRLGAPADPGIQPPADGNDYAANADYTQAPQIGTSQNFVVYKGSGSDAWVTGLTLDTNYSVAIYEYAGTDLNTDYLQLLPAEASQPTTNVPVHNEDNRVDCYGCHSHGSWMPRDTVLKDACTTCHILGGVAENKLQFDNHLTPSQNPNIEFVDCGLCHELHTPGATNTTQSAHPITGTIALNKAFLRANVDKYVPNAAAPANLHDGDTLPENTDIPKVMDGETVVTPANTPNRAVEGGDATTARGYCQVCHTYTKYHRSTGTSTGQVLPDGSTSTAHLQWPLAEGDPRCHDGTSLYDPLTDCGENLVSGLPTLNPGFQTHCGECHEHNNKFQGSGGAVSCVICHAPLGVGTTGPNSRPSITDQFDRLSKHISSSAVATEADCLVCHDQTGHSNDAIVGVKDLDTGAIYNQLTAGASTTDPAEGEQFEGYCLSCHDDGVAGSLPDDVYTDPPTNLIQDLTGQTKTSPFTGTDPATFALRIIDEVAWASAAHNRSTTPIVSCVGACHGTGHGSDQNKLLAPADTGGALPIPTTNFCLNCHDGTLPPAADIQAAFPAGITGNTVNCDPDPNDGTVTGTGTPCNFQTTSGSGALVNQRHDILTEDQAYSSASVSCANCHDPHVNNATDPVADVDTGSALNAYIPATYNNGGADADSTFGVAQPDYIQFCTACHDGAPPAGVVMDAGMVDIATSYWSTGNTGDHHGILQGGGSGNGFLKPPYDSSDTVTYSSMNCTDCHGAHGSPNIFNLKSQITIGGIVMTVGGWTGDSVGEVVGDGPRARNRPSTIYREWTVETPMMRAGYRKTTNGAPGVPSATISIFTAGTKQQPVRPAICMVAGNCRRQ